jgi:AcrR family transcriptional regulator
MSHRDITYDGVMARWQPGARDRLARAAFELFSERGFEQTTVTDIAARAGVDKRTFYRLFGDKREALFSGGQELQDFLVEAVNEVPTAGAEPFGAVLSALGQGAQVVFADRLEFARARTSVVETSAELRERESLKMGSLARALATALQAQGAPEAQAVMAAESGITVFRVAYARWVAPGNETPFPEVITEVAGELRAVTR